MRIVEIGLHRRIPDLVEEWQGATELAYWLQIGVHEEGGQALLCQLDRLGTLDLHILETVIGERRYEGLFSLAPQGVFIHLEHLTRLLRIVIDIDVALLQPSIRFQQLSMLDREMRARLSLHLQTAETGDVLRETIDIEPIRESLHGCRSELLGDVYARHSLGGQLCGRLLNHHGLFPMGILESGSLPTLLLQAGIETITTVDIIIGISTRGTFPGGIRTNRLCRAVGIGQSQLRPERGPTPPSRLMEIPGRHRLLIVPPIAQHGGQGILSLGQQVGHVMGDIENPFVEMGIAGIQEVLSHPFPIDGKLMITR